VFPEALFGTRKSQDHQARLVSGLFLDEADWLLFEDIHNRTPLDQ
jgi:hypothetical protein